MIEYYAQFWRQDDFIGDENDKKYIGSRIVLADIDSLVGCLRLIRKYGFHASRSELPTVRQYWNAFYSLKKEENPDFELINSSSSTKEELDVINSILKAGQELIPGNNSFLHNIKQLCGSTYWEAKYLSFLSAWINNQIESKRKEKEEPVTKSNEYLGQQGDKITIEVKLIKTMAFESYYGLSYLHICEDDKGNCVNFYAQCKKLEEDEVAKIRGSIKDLKDYKGRKQTVLTRVKIID
jgi:hypothetical protein